MPRSLARPAPWRSGRQGLWGTQPHPNPGFGQMLGHSRVRGSMAWVQGGTGHCRLRCPTQPSTNSPVSVASTPETFVFTMGLSRAMGVCVVVGAGLNSSGDKDKVLGAPWHRESSKSNPWAQAGQYGN